jgi:hypothetical protein
LARWRTVLQQRFDLRKPLPADVAGADFSRLHARIFRDDEIVNTF